ncbi:hypothetical protein K7432_008426 [Basidiobolus ranarum]|uniref:Uncharacterized protein n=1 Tax=Basidiobolus ranarum TaxID=34480 RepID=A0ABR2VZI8_9FUNG
MKLAFHGRHLIVSIAFLISSVASTKTAASPPLRVLAAVTHASYTHAAAQLEISKLLIDRQHDVYFAAFNYDLKWGSNISKLNLVDLGGVAPLREEFAIMLEQLTALAISNPDAIYDHNYGVMFGDYARLYTLFRNVISGQSQHGGPMDIVMCDFFARPCIDAAHSLNVPCIIVQTSLDVHDFGNQPYLPYLRSSSKVTLENASFWERLREKFILPLEKEYMRGPSYEQQSKVFKELGVTPYTTLTRSCEHSLVFIASVPWIDQPRPIPPNVHYIGPALPEHYEPLTPELQHFLDTHTRSVFISFGSLTTVKPHEFEAMVQSLTAAYHAELVDGVIWGLMNTHADELNGIIHTNSTTKSGAVVHQEHYLEDMQHGRHPFIRILERAPQRAVLKHPSVQLFISHCGLGSIHEAMEAGTPILGIPAFADQPSNALIIESLNAGRRISWKEVGTSTMHSVLEHMLSSPDAEKIQTTVSRLQRLVTIFNKRLDYAVDIVEMAAVPGLMKLIEPADQRMPWWKANNLDLWIAIITIVLVFGVSLIYASTFLIAQLMYIFFSSGKNKTE